MQIPLMLSTTGFASNIHLSELLESCWITTSNCFRPEHKNGPLLFFRSVTTSLVSQLNPKDSIYPLRPCQSSIGLGFSMADGTSLFHKWGKLPSKKGSCDAPKQTGRHIMSLSIQYIRETSETFCMQLHRVLAT